MEIADLERDSPAIRALGSLFKLTKVFLRDEASKEIRRGSSLPKHIIFKHEDDDEVNEEVSCGTKINSNVDGDDGDVFIEENNEIGQQMNALGLPLSFQTGKDKMNGKAKGKRKDTISSNESDGTCKSFKKDQQEHTADRLSSDARMAKNGTCESEITYTTMHADRPVAQLPLPTSAMLTNKVAEVACNELLFAQINEEDMGTIAGGIDNEATRPATKRKRKAKKSRSRKKSLKNSQEHLFQCTVDSYYGGIGKYWCQRYILFSKFDEGIKMDEEGWFSVTPECIARHQASRCGSGVIIDCFAGVGGNAIQFAKMGRHVIAIDICPQKIDYARHNAAVYGIDGQIDFVIGDSISLASKLKADTVFLSPPWGGPGYSKMQTYDISMLKPRNGQCLFDTFKDTASMIVMFLPRNVDLNQVAELCLSADPRWSVEVEKNFLNGKFKAVTVYFSRVSLCSV